MKASQCDIAHHFSTQAMGAPAYKAVAVRDMVPFALRLLRQGGNDLLRDTPPLTTAVSGDTRRHTPHEVTRDMSPHIVRGHTSFTGQDLPLRNGFALSVNVAVFMLGGHPRQTTADCACPRVLGDLMRRGTSVCEDMSCVTLCDVPRRKPGEDDQPPAGEGSR